MDRGEFDRVFVRLASADGDLTTAMHLARLVQDHVPATDLDARRYGNSVLAGIGSSLDGVRRAMAALADVERVLKER